MDLSPTSWVADLTEMKHVNRVLTTVIKVSITDFLIMLSFLIIVINIHTVKVLFSLQFIITRFGLATNKSHFSLS